MPHPWGGEHRSGVHGRRRDLEHPRQAVPVKPDQLRADDGDHEGGLLGGARKLVRSEYGNSCDDGMRTRFVRPLDRSGSDDPLGGILERPERLLGRPPALGRTAFGIDVEPEGHDADAARGLHGQPVLGLGSGDLHPAAVRIRNVFLAARGGLPARIEDRRCRSGNPGALRKAHRLDLYSDTVR